LAQGLVPSEKMLSSRLQIFGDVHLSQFQLRNPGFLEECSGKFFICSPGSVWRTKRYPSELLAELLCRILTSMPHFTCVLSGGPSDAESMNETLMAIDRRYPEFVQSGRIVDARSCLPLPELVELTRLANFVLTPDSAPLHIASATGTKTFVFFGPTPSDTGFGPLEKSAEIINHHGIKGMPLPCQPCSKHGHDRCPLGHHKCLADLPPDAIAARMLFSVQSHR
jgi:heptosyltransferase-2